MISEHEGTGGETRGGRKDEERQLEEEEERGRGRGEGKWSERGRESERWRGIGRGRGRGRGRGKERDISNKDEKRRVGGLEEVGKREARRSLDDMEREVEVERVREKKCERTKQVQG